MFEEVEFKIKSYFPGHFYNKYYELMYGKEYARYQYDLEWNRLFVKVSEHCRCGCGEKVQYRGRWFDKKHQEQAFMFYAMVKGLAQWFISDLLDLQNWRCGNCGRHYKYSNDFEADHDIALILGGTNLPGNWRMLCRECHLAKTKIDLMCKRLEKGKLKFINNRQLQLILQKYDT